jgi:hypothetical protein
MSRHYIQQHHIKEYNAIPMSSVSEPKVIAAFHTLLQITKYLHLRADDQVTRDLGLLPMLKRKCGTTVIGKCFAFRMTRATGAPTSSNHD